MRTRKVAVRDRGGRNKRTATTELRSARVELRPPPMAVWAAEVRQPCPPAGEGGLDWLLVSSYDDCAAEAAWRTVLHYELRWAVEEHLRLIKTSARVQDQSLRDAAGLARHLTFDAIEGCRMFDLQRLAGVEPKLPSTEVLAAADLSFLRGWLAKHPELLPPRERKRP